MSKKSHPSKDKTNRFAVDYLLRENGYTIHSRKKNEEPQWQRDGIIQIQSVILAELLSLDVHAVLDAEYAEDLYYSGYC